jgi:hypothetical protein
MTQRPQEPQPVPRTVLVAGAATAVLLVVLVGMTLRRPVPPSFEPTPVQSRPVGPGLAGPELVTIDATDSRRWQFFSFAQRSVVPHPGPRDWDLAFRRFQVIVNGGAGFAGDGGALDLGDLDFDDVLAVPVSGYIGTTARSDSTNPAIARWYRYSFTSHLLTPRPRVYAIRTADGRYAKLEFVGYSCPGAEPGCVTLRYTYQGGGDPHLVP